MNSIIEKKDINEYLKPSEIIDFENEAKIIHALEISTTAEELAQNLPTEI